MAASTERGPRRRLGRSGTGLAVLGVGAVLGGVVALEAAGTRSAALGAGLAVAMLLAWLAAGVPYAFVVGQIGLVIGPGAGTTALALQAALVGLLLVDVGERHDRQVLAVTAGAAAGLLGLIVVVDGLLATAGALLAAVGAAGYLLHRYELVALGLVGDAS